MNIPPLSRPPRITVAGLHGIALILLGLHLYVRTLPPTSTPIPAANSAEAAWWGFWPATYAPAWPVMIGTSVIIGSIALFWISELSGRHSKTEAIDAANPQSTMRNLHFFWFLGLSALLAIAFFAFPIVHTRWGDALLISKAIAWPDPAQRLTYSWQAPLDVFVHSRLWLYGHSVLHWKNAIPVYRLLSPIAGIFYLGLVLALTRNVQHAPPWLTFGLLVSLGLLQLFFGYIENYSFMTIGVLAYLWLALDVLAGKKPLWLPATVLAITHATHPSTIILAPSLLYCGWQVTKSATKRNQSLRLNVLQIGLPMIVVAGATIVLMQIGGHGLEALLTTDRPGGSDASFFVPLWKISTYWQHYTMFSWAHLRDFLNEQMLVAPIVLPSLIWLYLATKITDQRVEGATHHALRITQYSFRGELGFLILASLSYLLFTWVWNADYGGQRDRDLFSPVALPATCWLIALLPRSLPDQRYLRAGAIPLLMVQCLHTAAWIYQNRLPWHWPK